MRERLGERGRIGASYTPNHIAEETKTEFDIWNRRYN